MSTTQNAGLNLLRLMPKRLAELLQQYFEQRLRINKAPRLSSGASTDETFAAQRTMAQETANLVETTLAAIVVLRGETDKRATAATSDINRRLGRPAPADSHEAVLRELREQRAWARIRTLLDLAPPSALHVEVAEHALQALANGDDDALFALRAELPAYAQAKGVAEISPAILSALDGELAKARPAIADALQERGELEQGMRRLLTGFNYGEHAINAGELRVIIPSWNPKDDNHDVGADPVDHPA